MLVIIIRQILFGSTGSICNRYIMIATRNIDNDNE